MKKILPACIALIVFIGCEGNGDGGNGGAGPSGAEAYFPLQIGNQWKYHGWQLDALGDSIPGTAYTLFKEVIGDSTISGEIYSVLQDSSNASGLWETEIAQLVKISGDTVIFLMSFFADTLPPQRAIMAILPATINDEWTVLSLDTIGVSPEGDTVNISALWTGEILDFSSVSTPAGAFSDSYHLRYALSLEVSNPDTAITYLMESKSWTAPNVGIVKMTQFPWDGPDGPEPGDYQELVEYSVASP